MPTRHSIHKKNRTLINDGYVMFEDHRLDTFVNQHSATYSGHGMNEKIWMSSETSTSDNFEQCITRRLLRFSQLLAIAPSWKSTIWFIIHGLPIFASNRQHITGLSAAISLSYGLKLCMEHCCVITTMNCGHCHWNYVAREPRIFSRDLSLVMKLIDMIYFLNSPTKQWYIKHLDE